MGEFLSPTITKYDVQTYRQLFNHMVSNLAFLLFLLYPFSTFALVINVPADFATIQEAIDVASHGDEIIVSTGTYVENIDLLGKNLTLRSTNPLVPISKKYTQSILI